MSNTKITKSSPQGSSSSSSISGNGSGNGNGNGGGEEEVKVAGSQKQIENQKEKTQLKKVEEEEESGVNNRGTTTTRALESASARLSKWESATRNQPIYFEAKKPLTAILYLKLCEYDRWAVEDSESAVNALHKIHLFIDEIVKEYKLYKTETRAGEFIISCQAKEHSADYGGKVDKIVMEFASTILERIEYVENPSNRRLGMKIKIAVSCGQVYGAILGKSGVRYGMYGEADTIAKMLLSYVPDNHIVVSDSFYDNYIKDTHGWLKKDRIQIFPEEIGKKSIYITPYVYIGNNPQIIENPAPNTTTLSPNASIDPDEEGNNNNNNNNNGGNRRQRSFLYRIRLSMCYEDPATERNFRLYQAGRMYFVDALYMILSLVTIQTIFMRSLTKGVTSHLAFSLLMIAMICTLAPLFGMVFSNTFYVEHRHTFMITFRIVRILALVIHNGIAPNVMLETPNSPFLGRILVSNSCLIHGMHSIGAQVIFPYHLALQILVIVAVMIHNWLACNQLESNMHNIECTSVSAMIFSYIIQVLCMFALPTFVVYKIETMLRSDFPKSKLYIKKQD